MCARSIELGKFKIYKMYGTLAELFLTDVFFYFTERRLGLNLLTLPSKEDKSKLLCQEVVPSLTSDDDNDKQQPAKVENPPEKTQHHKRNYLSVKSRRRTERNAYESLREVIPSLASRHFNKKGITKLETVIEATRYIKELQNTLETIQSMTAVCTNTESQK